MESTGLRKALQNKLEEQKSEIVLRVALAPDVRTPVELTGPELADRARALARKYATVERSGVVLILLPHSEELFLLHLGLVLEGWIPAILPWPTSRMDPEKYQRNLLHQLRSLPAQQLITLPKLAANLGPALPFPVAECPFQGYQEFEKAFSIPFDSGNVPQLAGVEGREAVPPPPGALFLQFSGGTTGAQKAVVVTETMMIEQMTLLRETLDYGPSDGVASWLPMYHDMGLIACLWFPLWHKTASTQFSASDWLLQPELLFHYLERDRSTFCWLPNFAFSYLAGQRERMKGTYSLDHVRGFINCSEPVRARSMDQFAAAFSGSGVKPTALQASYAMAENVFAVTQTPLSAPPRQIRRSLVQRGQSREQQLAFDLLDDTYVSSGTALRGMEVRIAVSGQACGDLEAGEILLRTPCLFQGYWGVQGFVTSALSADGWYSTGDFGFVHDQHLYVIGRLKDIVIVGGQNVFPEDVEAVANGVDGVYPGRVVAFGVLDEENGTESLAVVAELRGGYEDSRARSLERLLKQQVLSAIGIAPRYVAVVPERWIVKSTAGKISRRDTRERFREERLRQTEPAH